jgi:hypothetical protein
MKRANLQGAKGASPCREGRNFLRRKLQKSSKIFALPCRFRIRPMSFLRVKRRIHPARGARAGA